MRCDMAVRFPSFSVMLDGMCRDPIDGPLQEDSSFINHTISSVAHSENPELYRLIQFSSDNIFIAKNPPSIYPH